MKIEKNIWRGVYSPDPRRRREWRGVILENREEDEMVEIVRL